MKIATDNKAEGSSTDRIQANSLSRVFPYYDREEALIGGLIPTASTNLNFLVSFMRSPQLRMVLQVKFDLEEASCEAVFSFLKALSTLNSMTCAAHKLQLCIRDTLKASTATDVEDLVRQKCRFFSQRCGWLVVFGKLQENDG